jgi:hypothetical protein
MTPEIIKTRYAIQWRRTGSPVWYTRMSRHLTREDAIVDAEAMRQADDAIEARVVRMVTTVEEVVA